VVQALPVLALLALAVLDVAVPTPASRVATLFQQASPRPVVLTTAEQQLVKSLPAEKRRDLLKQVLTRRIETARPRMEAMIHEVIGVKLLSLHHDISTVTGEEVMLFTMAGLTRYRQPKQR
jgi:hypothetical protein